MARKDKPLRMWPVRWRGIVTRDVGTACVWARDEQDARDKFVDDHPTKEIVGVGKAVTMQPVK